MSDEALLQAALAAYLSASISTGATQRTITSPGENNQLLAILTEVDQTVLPRRLIFTSATGEMLTLDVADRHILSVVAASGASVGQSADAVIGRPLVHPSAADIARLRAILSRCAASAAVLQVCPTRANIGKRSTIPGILASKLFRDDFGQFADQNSHHSTSIVDRFMAGLGALPLAMLRVENGLAVQECGPADQLAKLRNLLPAIGPDQPIADLTQDTEQLVVFAIGSPDGFGQAMLTANSGNCQVLATFDARYLAKVTNIWIDSTREPYDE